MVGPGQPSQHYRGQPSNNRVCCNHYLIMLTYPCRPCTHSLLMELRPEWACLPQGLLFTGNHPPGGKTSKHLIDTAKWSWSSSTGLVSSPSSRLSPPSASGHTRPLLRSTVWSRVSNSASLASDCSSVATEHLTRNMRLVMISLTRVCVTVLPFIMWRRRKRRDWLSWNRWKY